MRNAKRWSTVPLLITCICIVAIVRIVTDDRAAGMENLTNLVTRSTDGVEETSLKPRALFVAWNGVLTLTYEGFPEGLVSVKQRLNHAPEQLKTHLKPENFGSKWPKTTLAAVHDSAPPFTIERLRELRELCQRYTRKIPASAVPVSKLSIVQYMARGLESPSSRVDVSGGGGIMGPLKENSGPGMPPPPLEKQAAVWRGSGGGVISIYGGWVGAWVQDV